MVNVCMIVKVVGMIDVNDNGVCKRRICNKRLRPEADGVVRDPSSDGSGLAGSELAAQSG